MKTAFQVRVLKFSNLREIEGARTVEDFAALLDAMDYGDISDMNDEELREMCLLSLQDLGPEDAALVVLKHDMQGVLRDGQIQNAAGEMLDEKLWEEYVDPALHERMFIAGSLLYAAFPRMFPEPDAVRLELEVTAGNAAAKTLLTSSPHVSFLVRLLADGMDDDAILHRLYENELAGTSFPNAEDVVWTVRTEPVSDAVMKIDVISSGYWLDALQGTKSYESAAYPDEASPAARPRTD